MPLSVRAATEATSSVAALCLICVMPMTPCTKSFEQVVLGGALREFGMPSFSDDLTSAQVRSIEGYILSRAQSNRRRQMRRQSIDPLPSPEKP